MHIHETTGELYDVADYPSEKATPHALVPAAGREAGTVGSDGEDRRLDGRVEGASRSAVQRSLKQWGAGIVRRQRTRRAEKLPVLSAPQPGDTAYDTGPLTKDLRLAGPIGLRLSATSNRPETMFVVTLQDVGPDGRSPTSPPAVQLGSARSIDAAKSWGDGQGGYVLPYHPQTKATASPVPYRRGHVDTTSRSVRHSARSRKGHSLRLLDLAPGDTPHLCPRRPSCCRWRAGSTGSRTTP